MLLLKSVLGLAMRTEGSAEACTPTCNCASSISWAACNEIIVIKRSTVRQVVMLLHELNKVNGIFEQESRSQQ